MKPYGIKGEREVVLKRKGRAYDEIMVSETSKKHERQKAKKELSELWKEELK